MGIVLLSCTQILSEHRDFYGPYNQHGHQRHRHQNWDDDRMTKEVRVTQGRLRGFIVQPKTNPRMQMVDVFLGKSNKDYSFYFNRCFFKEDEADDSVRSFFFIN